jgi:talin
VAEAAINAASKMPHSQKQTDLLDETKTVAESATELLYAVKDAGGNPKVM